MRVPLLDLQAQYETLRSEIEPVVRELFESQQFVLGDTVSAFEAALCAWSGAAHAVGVASGSDALLLALMARDVGPERLVVTTPFTFFATAGAPARLGARIRFADIDPVTFNLDPAAVAATVDGEATSPERRVLIPVHLYGQVAPVEPLKEAAGGEGVCVVEDAAQAIGARFADGRQAGTVGDFGALSFFPSKNLGAAGDAGMVLVRGADDAERVRRLRVHGSERRYEHDEVGINSRLDGLQAAVLTVKLRHLDAWIAGRRDRARRYTEAFRDRGLIDGPLVVPPVAGPEHVFHQYVIRAERRDELKASLDADGIGNQVYYPLPLYRQACFAAVGQTPAEFPECERASREVLALPIYPELSDDQIDHVVDRIRAFYDGGASR